MTTSLYEFLYVASNTLPKPTNLKCWRLQVDDNFPLCISHINTTHDILNGHPLALSQGHYTWRHDSVLLKLMSFIKSLLSSEDKIYGKMKQDFTAAEPPHCCVIRQVTEIRINFFNSKKFSWSAVPAHFCYPARELHPFHNTFIYSSINAMACISSTLLLPCKRPGSLSQHLYLQLNPCNGIYIQHTSVTLQESCIPFITSLSTAQSMQ